MVELFDTRQADRLKSRVTYVGALVNLFLSVIKIGFGLIGHSAALIADGIHSVSDLVSDFFVLVAVKMGSREADRDHPYGHRRFETMATVVLGGALLAVAVGIGWDVWQRIEHPERLLVPSREIMGVAAISILANEWLYQYTKRIAGLTRSKLLLANAWHHRSDALSSIVVLIGVAAVFFGYPYADAIAALIVALMVAKMGLNLIAESLKELVDTSLPADIVREIRQSILATDGVRGIHLLRSRQMGEDAYVDAHIVVNPRISVSEGHMIGDAVRDKLIAEFDDVIDVLVHVDPEDDRYLPANRKPLSRKQVQRVLRHYLGNLIKQVENVNIHYLDGLLELEVVLPRKMVDDPNSVEKIKKQAALMQDKEKKIARVLVFIKT